MDALNDKSILIDIKKMLSIDSEVHDFDQDIILFINSAFGAVRQLGIGPKEGFRITSEEEKWSDFLGERLNSDALKTYIYEKVRLTFDTPQASGMKEAIEEDLKENEWRLRIQWDDEDSFEKEEIEQQEDNDHGL